MVLYPQKRPQMLCELFQLSSRSICLWTIKKSPQAFLCGLESVMNVSCDLPQMSHLCYSASSSPLFGAQALCALRSASVVHVASGAVKQRLVYLKMPTNRSQGMNPDTSICQH